MIIYSVLTLDMWGHVGADCHEYSCECMIPCPECPDDEARPSCEQCKGTGEIHDDDACSCTEECNAQYRAGRIEVDDGADDAALLKTLHERGYLSDLGLKECTIDDFTDGSWLDVNDAQGRRILALQLEESEQG